MNVVFVSHCDFTGNSAFHVLALAREARSRGLGTAVCVPGDSDAGAHDDVQAPCPVVPFSAAADGALGEIGIVPDVVHAFTPREHVRRLTESLVERYGSRYIVHLEDNEAAIVAAENPSIDVGELGSLPERLVDGVIERWRTHPSRSWRFLAAASGATVVIDTLRELVPAGIPTEVLWPGFDEQLLAHGTDREQVRRQLGVRSGDVVIVYPGNLHRANEDELRSLYLAVVVLRRMDYPVVLVRTGWDQIETDWRQELAEAASVRELGFVSRRRVFELLHAADVLVQPGGSNAFNDYRFPSKLPEFLASGRPVVLPRCNLGRYLVDRTHALLLDRGDALDIVGAVETLADDPDLRRRLGAAGRAYALEHLRWPRNVEGALRLYAAVGSERLERLSRMRPDPASPRDGALPVKLIAFYLPQFHRIPENDAWWGTGFTEWTNVRRARPLFSGHHQPQRPTVLGEYDLSDPSVLERQADMAQLYGIHGFCFYYYWFNGRRILELPLDRMLESGRPELPFCLCWANENWTRRWDGLDDEVLLRQEYSEGWGDRFIRDVLPFLADPRYIRVGDRPLLLVYRAAGVPDVVEVTARWRAIVRDELGVDLHLAAVQSFGLWDPGPLGFDAAVEFPPHTTHVPADRRAVRRLRRNFRGFLEDYTTVMIQQLGQRLPDFTWYRGVMPSWDNTARRGPRAHVVVGSSPRCYQTWLRKLVIQSLELAPVQEPLVFVNAWNEWGEGTHLEPDQRYGYAWLEATRAALEEGLSSFYTSKGLHVGPEQVRTALGVAS